MLVSFWQICQSISLAIQKVDAFTFSQEVSAHVEMPVIAGLNSSEQCYYALLTMHLFMMRIIDRH